MGDENLHAPSEFTRTRTHAKGYVPINCSGACSPPDRPTAHRMAAAHDRTAAINVRGSYYFPPFFLPFLLFFATRITPSPDSTCQRSVDRTASTYH